MAVSSVDWDPSCSSSASRSNNTVLDVPSESTASAGVLVGREGGLEVLGDLSVRGWGGGGGRGIGEVRDRKREVGRSGGMDVTMCK